MDHWADIPTLGEHSYCQTLTQQGLAGDCIHWFFSSDSLISCWCCLLIEKDQQPHCRDHSWCGRRRPAFQGWSGVRRLASRSLGQIKTAQLTLAGLLWRWHEMKYVKPFLTGKTEASVIAVKIIHLYGETGASLSSGSGIGRVKKVLGHSRFRHSTMLRHGDVMLRYKIKFQWHSLKISNTEMGVLWHLGSNPGSDTFLQNSHTSHLPPLLLSLLIFEKGGITTDDWWGLERDLETALIQATAFIHESLPGPSVEI